MSTTLFARSEDLSRLLREGYEVSTRSDHLLVEHVPFVTADKTVAYGTLISELTSSGSQTARPSTHVMYFAGGTPCDDKGQPLSKIINSSDQVTLATGLVANCMFSAKPPSGAYANYYEKFVRHINTLASYAQVLDPTATAQTYADTAEAVDEPTAFRYPDTASSRAGIRALTERLRSGAVAIIGLGGTGGYILDLVAKTPVKEIQLYDPDEFLAHNAFRSPGAASVEELDAVPTKVSYFAGLYGKMRDGIVAHAVAVDESNVRELGDMDFVFIAIDSGTARRSIVAGLEDLGVPFIDVGMGIDRQGDALAGLVRVTASRPGHREHVHEMHRIPFTDPVDDLYGANIQIADMNALNAVLAVTLWKQLQGFYARRSATAFTTYSIASGQLLSEGDE